MLLFFRMYSKRHSGNFITIIDYICTEVFVRSRSALLHIRSNLLLGVVCAVETNCNCLYSDFAEKEDYLRIEKIMAKCQRRSKLYILRRETLWIWLCVRWRIYILLVVSFHVKLFKPRAYRSIQKSHSAVIIALWEFNFRAILALHYTAAMVFNQIYLQIY